MTHSRNGSTGVQSDDGVSALPHQNKNGVVEKSPQFDSDTLRQRVAEVIEDEDDLLPSTDSIAESKESPTNPPGREYVWRNIIFFIYLHVGAVYGLYLALTKASWFTLFWCKSMMNLAVLFHFQDDFLIFVVSKAFNTDEHE